MADANERRDWRVYKLIAVARPLYAGKPFGAELDNTVYALDSTTIDVCLSLCPWAPFEHSRGAVKMRQSVIKFAALYLPLKWPKGSPTGPEVAQGVGVPNHLSLSRIDPRS